jgi:4-diphosphocytidyl-2-C-methyl-D-erythritol kinase
MRLGARLGADIPFCVMGGSALVTGIGDCLEPIDPMPPQTLVVACQGEGISTPWGYGKLDELHGFFADRSFDDSVARGIARAMKSKESFDTCHDFYNIFEEIVPTVQPYVDRIKNAMKEAGARFAMMSGSGPSVFGLFDDPDQAMAACERLKKDGAAAFVCHPTAKYPV